jgi:hypothetical protein
MIFTPQKFYGAFAPQNLIRNKTCFEHVLEFHGANAPKGNQALDLASKYKKYGAPMIATTIPVGISEGWRIQRAIVSAVNSSNAPTKAQAGSRI